MSTSLAQPAGVTLRDILTPGRNSTHTQEGAYVKMLPLKSGSGFLQCKETFCHTGVPRPAVPASRFRQVIGGITSFFLYQLCHIFSSLSARLTSRLMTQAAFSFIHPQPRMMSASPSATDSSENGTLLELFCPRCRHSILLQF